MFFKNNSTKEKIIKILSKNWPLSITEIQTTSKFNVSYQYIRQCLNELVEEKVLKKKGLKYELSEFWLEQVNQFSRQSLDNYRFGIKNNILSKETSQIRVSSLEELGNFMLEALEINFLEKKDKRGFFSIVNHLWIPFVNKNKLNRLRSIKENMSVIYTQKCLLDKVLEKATYKKHVKKIKFVNTKLDYDLFVYNNCILQIYFPEELKVLMNQLYSKDFDVFKKVSDLFSMTFKEFPITIVITRNKEIANSYRSKFDLLFGVDKK